MAEHFQARGVRVFVPELDPTRGIEFRGGQLRDQVTAALGNGALDPHSKTHIIAHSMGGLDSRYMLSPANAHAFAPPVRSLTTISTPHRGSPIADAIDARLEIIPFPHLPFGPPESPVEAVLNVLGISLDSLRDLTTARCQAFSDHYSDHPAVAYFSVAGAGRAAFPQTAAALMLFRQYIHAATGQANDGLVSLQSAAWGAVDPHPWQADHVEEVGYDLDRLPFPPAFGYLAKFDAIADKVAAL